MTEMPKKVLQDWKSRDYADYAALVSMIDTFKSIYNSYLLTNDPLKTKNRDLALSIIEDLEEERQELHGKINGADKTSGEGVRYSLGED